VIVKVKIKIGRWIIAQNVIFVLIYHRHKLLDLRLRWAEHLEEYMYIILVEDLLDMTVSMKKKKTEDNIKLYTS
jgi:hypothetical protein